MRYVVLGASAAGINGARELRSLDRDAEIILISKDDEIYSRCIIHHYLSGERTLDELRFVEENFIRDNNIDWKKGVSVVDVNTVNKVVTLHNNEKISYDKLLVATGSRSVFPKIAHINECKNIYGFRDLDDVIVLKEKVKTAKNIVVLGGGLVGMDAVCGTLDLGINNITVVELADRVLSMQLDKRAASSYEKALEEKGVRLIFNNAAVGVERDSNNNVSAVNLKDGGKISCDLLIVTVGVKSNCEFLENSEVIIDECGVVVDSFGRTNVADVYAAGDVTGRGPIWSVATKEGIVAANNMCFKEAQITDFFYVKSTMNFLGINTMAIGSNEAPDESHKIELYDDGSVYKKVIHKDGYITGAILQNDIAYGGVITKLVANKINASQVEKPLFKIDFSDFFNIDERNSELYYTEDI
ncbi:MAG: NAD(P)/FAD-dependent oxidoreductase [Lachnospirales bacterium]